MNWSRARLKEMARNALHGSYWKCVLVSLLLSIAVGGESFGAVRSSITEIQSRGYGQHGHFFEFSITPEIFSIAALAGIFILTIGLAGLALRIFLFLPLEVSCKNYYRQDIFYPADLGALSRGFSSDYLNIVKTQFLRILYTFLWGLLLIIPGIVKSYEYRMMPYIQAEHPEMSTHEVFELSKRMMYGEKWNIFVLDLSFLGWDLLSLCTFGLLEFFYVRPYKDLTNGALYGALKQKMEMQQTEYGTL